MLKKCFLLFKWWIFLYVLLGFLVQFSNTYGIKIFQELLDKVVISNSFNELTKLLILYGILLVGSTILNYIIEYPQVYLSNSILEKLKIMALTKVSKIDYRSYQNIGTGEMIKIIENGATAGTSIIYSFYLRIFHELLPTIIFSLLFIGFYSIKIMLIIALGYILIFFLTNLLLKFLYSVKSSLLTNQENMSKYSIRGFMELVVFRINRRYENEIKRLNNTANDIIQKSAQIRMIHESFFAIFSLLVNIIKVIVLIFGVKNILSGDASIGVIVALLMFIDKVYTPVAIFNVLYVDYKLNQVTYKRFEDFLNAPEDKNLVLGKEIKSVNGNVEFKNVVFNYSDTVVLDNVSFSIQQGTSVAIVGLSGSGKSTIIKLLLGLLKKKSGNIFIDGTDIDNIKLNSLYEYVSYISQDAPIFDTTIRSNIIFDDKIPDEEIFNILDKVHLKEKILSFPEKLDTMVGERGMKLSGGERQRLAFGRIIAQKRNLVILDEPVSALDNITEKSIMDYILSLFRGKTVIIIAHRLNFIKNVNKILLVRDGKIIDEGNFEYLIENNTYFQELWNKETKDKCELSTL
ncbi:ABC transporter ATP-binding protein [Bacillus atrophaeus]|uniref:ABC transporter ATP-binding protein n=1 Tax=Bacillus atrophaeus TaxID=1452 RepID=UPI00227F2365|nr:ABC transporter ATP-binding protein [Bacillus atrophaeus]MCY8487022.1 ABC transporter ATP-binding protein/permease [Bacillus atrophaeus]MCY8490944.1 ABC transporter ATP-binding protein/permease [Bacillus atrophaeus]MCY8817824.1 ABC transporter ATP-binding protein/permease [Bacillus atrophaeus]